VVYEGRLYHVEDGEARVVPSGREIVEVCRAYHDELGHFGFSTVME